MQKSTFTGGLNAGIREKILKNHQALGLTISSQSGERVELTDTSGRVLILYLGHLEAETPQGTQAIGWVTGILKAMGNLP